MVNEALSGNHVQPLTLKGRVALVTGGGRGLGREHALALAAAGAAVVVNDFGGAANGKSRGDPAPADAVVREIRARGGAAVAHPHSIIADGAAQSAVDLAIDTFGGLDILVNNAGVAVCKAFEEHEADDFERIMAVHYFGTVATIRSAWPYFLQRRFGRIVNTVSAAVFGVSGWAAYAAAKGAIFSFTRSLAVEGRKHGIAVNAIAPHGATRMGEEAGMSKEKVARMSALQPAGAVSPAVVYLASDACALNGDVLTVSSGFVGRWSLGEQDVLIRRDFTAEELACAVDNFSEDTPCQQRASTEESVRSLLLHAKGGDPSPG